MIDITKKYQTRDGRAVTLKTTTAKNGTGYVVQGHIAGEPDNYVDQWTIDGWALYPDFEHKEDLIEVTD